jgi:diguanylate cyclase (GGDEF)-like protein
MISLKKLIDSSSPDPKDLLDAYHSALASMGASGQQAVPILGTMIQCALSRISDRLRQSVSRESIRESRRMVEEQLSLWADSAVQNRKESERAIRDLLAAAHRMAETTGTRDDKFSLEISELSERLRTVTGLSDLPAIRRSILENTAALNTTVVKMADEGRESIRRLNSEIAEYQNRLVASERRALIDPLTGLANRRGFEQQLEQRIRQGQPFSLLVADLNGFKTTNDNHGHPIGDEILRQFGAELKAQFLPADTVARWGGDEFVVIVGGSAKECSIRAERVRHWALGEYKVMIDGVTISVTVDAAIGVTTWNETESGAELFARADREMYRAKQESRAKSILSSRTSTKSDAGSPGAVARRGGRSATV